LGFGLWALGFGLWALGFGLWALGFGLWALGFGLWALGFSREYLFGKSFSAERTWNKQNEWMFFGQLPSGQIDSVSVRKDSSVPFVAPS